MSISPTYLGGIRHRLIYDSVFLTTKSAMSQLGWLQARAGNGPVIMNPDPIDDQDDNVALNTLALADEGTRDTGWEIGSAVTEMTWTMAWDFFAESKTVGMQVAHDLRDILAGRMPSVGRTEATVQVMDYTQATPTFLFLVYLDNIRVDRAHGFPQPFRRWWYSVSFECIEEYGVLG